MLTGRLVYLGWGEFVDMDSEAFKKMKDEEDEEDEDMEGK